MADGSVNLPPGFYFCPTDEELILHFLYPKAFLLPFHQDIIPDFDFHLQDPWELKGKAFTSGDKHYFFSRKTGNKVTESGFWKDQDIEEHVFTSDGKKVGMKRCLVFYVGEAPGGIETNWVMEEYHLGTCDLPNTSYRRTGYRKLDFSEWVLCKVLEKKSDSWSSACNNSDDDNASELSYLDEVFLSLEDDAIGSTDNFNFQI